MGGYQSGYAAAVAGGYDQDGSNWNRNPNTDGYESHFGKGPKNDKRSKERNQERVSDMLHDDHDLDASEIDVSTDDNGEVTLSGTVGSRMDKRRAEDCAYRVRSVRHVQNNIAISDKDDDRSSSRSSGASATRTSASV
ncbi:MAG: BON domain-containing protein [Pacificimonas sp.]